MTAVARGQITIRVATDAYAVYQGVDKVAISCDHTGKVLSTLTINSVLSVRCGEIPITDFSIGAIATPVGFYSITVNQRSKTVTYVISGNNTTLADAGTIAIPVIVNGQTFTASFGWFKVKTGVPGQPGIDSNLLDWVADWNSGKTVIDAQSLITPKIFAGVKNSNGTITGTAIGKFALSTRNALGVITSEVVNGIYGFNDGNKTFEINASGNVQLGNGNEYIKYNAVTGKVEFGSAVALAWVGATYIDANGIFTGTLSANTVNAIRINASQITAGTISADRIDTASLKSVLITADNINALTLNVTKGTIGGWSLDADSIFRGTRNNTSGGFTATSGSVTIGSNGIRGLKWRLDSSGAGAVAGGNISWDAAGNVTFGSSVSLNWITPINSITNALGGSTYSKLTQISATGIYTGTITASQITAGTIDTARLNVDALKATLITAGNIEALTLNVTKGIIGGWTINSSSISGGQIMLDKANNRIVVYGSLASSTSGNRVQLYHNSNADFGLLTTDSAGNAVVQLGYVNKIAGWTINSTQIYKNSVFLGADGSITNGTKWKLNNDGSGQVAGGNISWNAAGSVTFASSVSLQWSAPINSITNALGGSSFPKMTYINSSGIYTGTLTANQVNAVAISATSIITGILSADRIAAGSINATKLDATSIKSSIINTDYINGLSCTFVRGKIGGFTIGSDHISTGGIGAMGTMPIQIRTAASGSGYWYTGEYRPFGISLTWHQSSNAGHIVFGQIASAGNGVKTGFMGVQMMSWDGVEYFCLSTNYLRSGSKEVYNRIAGWAFDNATIWKNSVYLGSDGSIYNSTKWRLSNDGSGRVASGNISWDVAGNVTFGSSVSLNWINAANNALNSAKSYTDTQTDAAKELASAMAYGKMLFRDPTFFDGNNSTSVYNNSSNGTVTINRTYDSTAPNDSKYLLRIANVGSASPGCGGFYFGHMCSYRKVFITRIIAKIPSGRTIQWASNAIGDGGRSKWLTSNSGTGDWAEYVYKVVCGTGNFSSTNFFYIEGSTPLSWDVAYATVFDITAVEKYTTTIDANGIYTGTITASQITAGTLSADRINTESIRAAIITAGNINALTLTIDKGYIGGWIINSSQIAKNGVVLSSDGSIVNGVRWKLNNDGSGQLANGNISWDINGNVTMTGTINANSGTIGGFTIGHGRIGSVASGTGSGGGLAIYDNLFRVGSSISYALFGDNTIPASVGGATATGRIVNNRYNSRNTNYGLYIDVQNGTKNFGVYSNAPCVAPSFIGNKIVNIYFSSSSYSIDFSKSNMFFIYASQNYTVTLPSESSVAYMFGYSSLPSDFAYVFTFVYNYNWGNTLTFRDIRDNNANFINHAMARGDVLCLMVAKYPSFHYQLLWRGN